MSTVSQDLQALVVKVREEARVGDVVLVLRNLTEHLIFFGFFCLVFRGVSWRGRLPPFPPPLSFYAPFHASIFL